MNLNESVTRLEVIDETGRVYSQWDCRVELSYQDNGRTLKVFVTKEPTTCQPKSSR